MELPILISCGEKKRDVPCQAWEMYTGRYFQTMLKVALTLSSDVKIVSAGYGLLALNDIISPYDLKMTASRALYFKKLKVVGFECHHLLGYPYAGILHLPSRDLLDGMSLSMANRERAAVALVGGVFKNVDLRGLPPGRVREFIGASHIQQFRRGKRENRCAYIGEIFAKEFLTIEEACRKIEKKFGPPLGLTYRPTVKRQLVRYGELWGHIEKDYSDELKRIRYRIIRR